MKGFRKVKTIGEPGDYVVVHSTELRKDMHKQFHVYTCKRTGQLRVIYWGPHRYAANGLLSEVTIPEGKIYKRKAK